MKPCCLYKAILLFLLPILCAPAMRGQSTFMAGAASISIDPDSSIFSVALAGYGAPGSGRFSIEWQLEQTLNSLQCITAAGDKLYAVNTAGELLVAAAAPPKITWKKAGNAKDLKAITGAGNRLYAITTDNRLQVLDLATKKGWGTMAMANDAVTLTLLNGILYAITAGNELLQGSIGNTAVTWKKMGAAKQLITLVNDGRKLYGADAENTLFTFQPGISKTWLKIGVNNGITYDISIKQLLVYKKRLFALSTNDRLVKAVHNTDHSLSARSLAIKSGNKTVVIVTLDLTGIDYSFGEAVKAVIYKKRKIPPSAILINSSHTHFSPVAQWYPTFGEHEQVPDSNYLNNILKKGVIRSIEKALDNMSPSGIWFGRGSTNIGHNRSSGDAENPYDRTVDVLKFEHASKKISDLLFITGCHPVFRNEGKEGVRISANYPGVSRDLLEKETGAKTALFLQGCGGDINPRDNDHRKTGSELAADVLRIMKKDQSRITGAINYTLDSIEVPTHPWSKEKIEQFKTDNSNKPGDLYAAKNVRWANLMLEYYTRNAVPATMPVFVQTITVGNWKLVGLSREVVTEYGPAIRAIWPDKFVSIAGYCNDVASYLPAGRHIKAGTYEGNDSFFWNAQPSFFPEDILDIVVKGIEKIKDKH